MRAVVDGAVVGSATLALLFGDEGAAMVDLQGDPAWRRRGIGTRLLREVASLAGSRRATALVVSARADNQAALAVVLASGLCGRIRVAGETLTVRIPVGDLAPLAVVPMSQAGARHR